MKKIYSTPSAEVLETVLAGVLAASAPDDDIIEGGYEGTGGAPGYRYMKAVIDEDDEFLDEEEDY